MQNCISNRFRRSRASESRQKKSYGPRKKKVSLNVHERPTLLFPVSSGSNPRTKTKSINCNSKFFLSISPRIELPAPIEEKPSITVSSVTRSVPLSTWTRPSA